MVVDCGLVSGCSRLPCRNATSLLKSTCHRSLGPHARSARTAWPHLRASPCRIRPPSRAPQPVPRAARPWRSCGRPTRCLAHLFANVPGPNSAAVGRHLDGAFLMMCMDEIGVRQVFGVRKFKSTCAPASTYNPRSTGSQPRRAPFSIAASSYMQEPLVSLGINCSGHFALRTRR